LGYATHRQISILFRCGGWQRRETVVYDFEEKKAHTDGSYNNLWSSTTLLRQRIPYSQINNQIYRQMEVTIYSATTVSLGRTIFQADEDDSEIVEL
jgi:hypothetical protein